MTSFSERLKYIRKVKGITQQNLADAIGVSQSAIATYERGRNPPLASIKRAICQAYNVSFEWLDTGDGEPFVQLSREAEISRWVGDVLRDESPTDRARLLHALIGATPEEIHAICQFARRLAAEFDDE